MPVLVLGLLEPKWTIIAVFEAYSGASAGMTVRAGPPRARPFRPDCPGGTAARLTYAEF
jgi:hypothetical protein